MLQSKTWYNLEYCFLSFLKLLVCLRSLPDQPSLWFYFVILCNIFKSTTSVCSKPAGTGPSGSRTHLKKFPGVLFCQTKSSDWQFPRNINPTFPYTSPTAYSKLFAFPLHRLSWVSQNTEFTPSCGSRRLIPCWKSMDDSKPRQKAALCGSLGDAVGCPAAQGTHTQHCSNSSWLERVQRVFSSLFCSGGASGTVYV